MANEALVLDPVAPPRLTGQFLATVAFVALTLLVFVGFQPFVPPRSGTPLAAAAASQGDLIHQIFYLGVAALVFATGLQQSGLRALRAMPFSLAILQAWCLLSAIWATTHGIAFRRATLEVLLTFSVLLNAQTLGHERTFRYWRIVLAAILVVNWVSIPLIPTAVHLPGEIDPGLVGDWRGLYGQKNAAGAVCAMTIILFLFTHNGRRNWIGYLVSAAAFGFLVMTKSKTSLGLLPICLLAGWGYRVAWRSGLGRAIFVCVLALLLVLLAAAGLFYADTISHMLEDPTEFTGRAEIWQAYIAFVRDHPWLGAGFGTLSNTGTLSPMHDYVRTAWVEAIGDSHDGYLQLFVTLGSVGFALAMVALVAVPAWHFWPADRREAGFKALLFSLFVFFVLHNFMESDFLEGDSGVWFAMLLVLAALRSPRLRNR